MNYIHLRVLLSPGGGGWSGWSSSACSTPTRCGFFFFSHTTTMRNNIVLVTLLTLPQWLPYFNRSNHLRDHNAPRESLHFRNYRITSLCARTARRPNTAGQLIAHPVVIRRTLVLSWCAWGRIRKSLYAESGHHSRAAARTRPNV